MPRINDVSAPAKLQFYGRVGDDAWVIAQEIAGSMARVRVA
jgi:hypothetical protein